MLTRTLRALVAFCFFATAAFSADTVELLPGKITGSLVLSSESISSGSVYAYATDGSGSASASLSGSSYSLTVPAGKTWRLNFSVSLSAPSGTYSQFSVNTIDTVSVGANETVTKNYSYATARVVADVQVSNGSLASFGTMQGYGSQNVGGANLSFSSYTTALGHIVALTMPNVSVYGTANLVSTSNQASSVALTSTTVDVPSSGATVVWKVDAAFISSTVQGTVALTGGPDISSLYIYLYGPNSINRSASLTGNGTFQFDGLQAGSYTNYVYAYFANATLYLYKSFDLAAGGVATLDYTRSLAQAKTPVEFTGFLTADNVSGGQFYANGPDGASGYGNFTSGSFNNVFTAGDWSLTQFSLYSYYSNGYFSLNSYDPYRPAKTYAAGDNVTLPAISLNTTETEITFDVLEPAGATSETLISYPQVSGSVNRYGSNGQYLGSSSFNAQMWVSNVAKPSVRIVGEPGTYTLQAYATVDGSNVSFGSFNIELKAPLPTPVGTDVTVTPGAGVTLQFDNVTTAGVTTVSQLPVGPALTDGYSNLTSNGAKVYYSASSTATFSGYIDVTIAYDPATVPTDAEGNLHLFYYDKPTETWIDITTSVDTVNNTISGTAPGLSTFAIGLPHAPVINAISVPADVEAGTDVTVVASYTDSDPGDSVTATWAWGEGQGNSGGLVDTGTGTITGTHQYQSGGTYTGTLTLTDSTGLSTTQTFSVNVRAKVVPDTTAPVISTSGSATVEATSASGAVVNFTVSASDDKDGSITATPSIASGSTFPLGSTTVTVTATDAAGNTATSSFVVTVADTVAPVITAPANVSVLASGSAGAAATFEATATDATGVTITYSHAPGSTFPVGTTTVTATATDAAGNTASTSFTVTVTQPDTTAPTLTVSANLTAEATSAAGAVVNYPAATATDAGGIASLTYSVASGSTFPIGTTTVAVTAIDNAGNQTVGSFTVTVKDSTKPVIKSITPSTTYLWPVNNKMVAVTLNVVATDLVGLKSVKIVSVTSNQTDKKTQFAITGDLSVNLLASRSGKEDNRVYTITVQAVDNAGNTVTKTVKVTVPHDLSKFKKDKDDHKDDDDHGDDDHNDDDHKD